MPDQDPAAVDRTPTPTSSSELDLFSGNAAAVAQQAEVQGQTETVRGELKVRLQREIELNRQNAGRQFEQAVVWRRWNILLGLVVGLLVAASGATALFTHTAAAIIGLLAAFGTGALATLGAGQRKSQAQSAGCAYREIEAAAREFLTIELPFVPLAEAITRTNQMTTRRLQVARIAEPPGSRALRRSDRIDKELATYNQRLSYPERSRLIPWVKPPPITPQE